MAFEISTCAFLGLLKLHNQDFFFVKTHIINSFKLFMYLFFHYSLPLNQNSKITSVEAKKHMYAFQSLHISYLLLSKQLCSLFILSNSFMRQSSGAFPVLKLSHADSMLAVFLQSLIQGVPKYVSQVQVSDCEALFVICTYYLDVIQKHKIVGFTTILIQHYNIVYQITGSEQNTAVKAPLIISSPRCGTILKFYFSKTLECLE